MQNRPPSRKPANFPHCNKRNYFYKLTKRRLIGLAIGSMCWEYTSCVTARPSTQTAIGISVFVLENATVTLNPNKRKS